MKRPSLQFYPGDWKSNANLRRCTFAERGIWLDVMCLMHDQTEYGVLRWPLKEIAQSVGCKLSDLQSIARKNVLKGNDARLTEAFLYVPRSGRKDGAAVTLIAEQDGPIWYSSRMVKDEYVRTLRADNGSNGEASKPSPKGGMGEGLGTPKGPRDSSSSSSTSVKDKNPPRKTKTPKTGLPEGFSLDPELSQYVTDRIPDADPAGLFESFTGKAAAKGWQYANWRMAFQEFTRNAMPNSGHFSAGQYPKKISTDPFAGMKWT